MLFVSVLVAGSFLAVAVRPARPAPAAVTVLVALASMLVSFVAGLEWPLLMVAALGVVPWGVHAERMFAGNRRSAGVIIGDVTMGVDHYALQGGLALALVALALLAAVWPRGRRFAGVSVGRCAGYVGLVSFAFPGTWAGFSPLWSALGMAWGVAVAALALPGVRSEQRELRGEVVEAQ